MLKPSLILTAAEIWLRLLFLSVYPNPTSENGDEFFIQIPAACLPSTFIWNDLGLWHLSYFLNWPWLLPKIFAESLQSVENFVQSWQLEILNTCLEEYRVPFFMTFSDPNRERVPVFARVKCFAAKVARSCFQIKPDSPTRGTQITGMCLPFEKMSFAIWKIASFDQITW